MPRGIGMSTKRFIFSVCVSLLLLAPASSMYAMRSQTVCGWVQYWYIDPYSGSYIEIWMYGCWEEIVVDAGLGHRASAGCTLSQFNKTASNQSMFEVFYLSRIGGDEVDLSVKSRYYRTFAGNIRQTVFCGAGFVEGPDNGHNKYGVIEDAFKADYNSLYYVGNSLATIDVDFQMTPYFGSGTAIPLGNTCDSASVFPVDLLTQWRCGRIDEYASPSAQAGTAVIQAAEPATYAYGSGFVFFGDKTLTIFP